MGIELVTGSLGGDTPHVTSDQDAYLHASFAGVGGYLLKVRDWETKPVMKDANNVTIPAWELMLEGRQMHIDMATDVNIQSGSQGQKRRDLVVARYAKDPTSGVETASLMAIKGTATSGTPVDPAYESGSIMDGAIVSDLPLCRINLDGITVTKVDTLVNVIQPLEDVWDSLSQTQQTISKLPRVFTGTSLVTQGNAKGWAELWNLDSFRAKFGRDWTTDTYIGVMNSHWDAANVIPLGVRYVESSRRLDVVFDKNTGVQTRVNWIVAFPA
ncbi:hypothetical protein KIH77_08890 [Bifidobacterium sp. 82T24]|uniref:hypothetical protein n=1 Tax=Bifidobacterium pluvialisilvae TaxID=2834436 RepID=UPI001C57C911|nr:hypothetical protein [Bifidobacterium pluvialisilvae]MBW3088836.1 hypothetical protein [Bifidobacterium pluvialisilvae]